MLTYPYLLDISPMKELKKHNSYKEKQTLVAAPCHGMETNSQYHWEVIPDGDFIKLRHRYYRQCIQFQ